jgi:hypothetical protein
VLFLSEPYSYLNRNLKPVTSLVDTTLHSRTVCYPQRKSSSPQMLPLPTLSTAPPCRCISSSPYLTASMLSAKSPSAQSRTLGGNRHLSAYTISGLNCSILRGRKAAISFANYLECAWAFLPNYRYSCRPRTASLHSVYVSRVFLRGRSEYNECSERHSNLCGVPANSKRGWPMSPKYSETIMPYILRASRTHSRRAVSCTLMSYFRFYISALTTIYFSRASEYSH